MLLCGVPLRVNITLFRSRFCFDTAWVTEAGILGVNKFRPLSGH